MPPENRQTPGVYELSWFIMEHYLEDIKEILIVTTDNNGDDTVAGHGDNTLDLAANSRRERAMGPWY